MDNIIRLKATNVLAKIDSFLTPNWDHETFQENRKSTDKLVCEALRLFRSTETRLSFDEIHISLNKLIAYYSRTIPDSDPELKVALQYLNACFAIRLALCIEREILTMTPHLNYSIEYWRARKAGTIFSTALQPVNIAFGLGKYWWLVEKTPWFWFRYFIFNRHTYDHPKKELRFKLNVLKKIRKINAIFVGAINYLWSFSTVESEDNLNFVTGRVLTLVETYSLRMKQVVTDSMALLSQNGSNTIDMTGHSLKDERLRWVDQKTDATNINSHTSFLRAYHVAREASIVVHDTWQAYRCCKSDSWYKRYWFATTVTTASTMYLLKEGYFHYRSAIDYWNMFKEMTYNFTMEHIWEPVVNIYETIRFNKGKESVVTEKALEESVASLGRMVTDWNNEQHPGLPAEKLLQVAEQAKLGNISTIMRAYEGEMAHPFVNALLGDFVRLALIQIQKQKGPQLRPHLRLLIEAFPVDLERAMLKMDKLLQQNELNFQLMATVPAVLAVYGVYHFLTRDTNPYAITHTRLRQLLRQTAILLNRNNDTDRDQDRDAHLVINRGDQQRLPMDLDQFGLLVLLVSEMQAYAGLLPHDEQRWFFEDLRELVVERYELQQRLTTLQRMYGSYSFLGQH